MALGVYGKHPAKGDFLEYGLPAGLRPLLEVWLDSVLAETRESLGQEWEYRWHHAPMLRFWLGEGIWGQPVAGVMAPTQDRVGRRFPLVVVTTGEPGQPAPPAVDPDQSWYDAAEAHLAATLTRADLSAPSALIEGLIAPACRDDQGGPGDFWAVREGAALSGLWSDVALTDHRRAVAGRSYWWVAGAELAPVSPDPAPLSAEVAVQLPDPDAAGDEEQIEPPAAMAMEVEEAAETVTATDDLPEAEAEAPAPRPTVETAAEAEADGGDTPAAEMAEGSTADSSVRPIEVDAGIWALDDEADGSPFAAPAQGLGLFAPPEPGQIELPQPVAEPQAASAGPHPRAFSQVWAGPGLPSGQVIAWFLRGFQQNG